MRLFTIIFCCSILISCTSNKEEIISLEKDVSVLADDTFNGRKTGTEGELQAAAYIEQRFEQIGLQPKGMMGAYT
ncbi:MAG: peptidase M28, partial [Flavobacteriaceae bacterium]|nr:peptidase M28 [Flavobacteriaceae bacterium]